MDGVQDDMIKKGVTTDLMGEILEDDFIYTKLASNYLL